MKKRAPPVSVAAMEIARLGAALHAAEAARDFAQNAAAYLRYATQPFVRAGWAGIGWHDTTPLVLHVTTGDMRLLNQAAGGGNTALALQARLGRLVMTMPYGAALWLNDPYWRVGQHDGQTWAWGPGYDCAIEALEGNPEVAHE
jgi:hypothetical protein